MILNRQRGVRVALAPLRKFLGIVLGTLQLQKADVTVCLVRDAEMARMNHAFRKKQGPTDVLSFPSYEKRDPILRVQASRNTRATLRRPRRPRQSRRTYLGDIAIAPAVARRNAKRDGRALQNELRVLILHGVLHLLGYDHETDQGQMERLEKRLRRRFGLA